MTSTPPTASNFIVVSNIRVRGILPEPRYFLRISLGHQELETTKAKPYDSGLEWATPVTLTIEEPKSSELAFELFSIAKDSVFRFPKKSSAVSIGKSVMTWDQTNSEVTSHEISLGGVAISCNLQVSTMEKLVKKDLDDASQSAHALKQLAVQESVDMGGELLGKLQPAFDAAQPFLEKFEAVVSLMDKLTKVHPYVNAAWVVLSAIPKVYIQELAENKKVMDLLESLNETYKFIIKDENLQQLDSEHIQELISLLADHTRECAYFIQSHASKSHRARLVDTVFASPEKRIDDLLKRLEELQKKLMNLLTQAAAVGAMQTKDNVATAIAGIAFVGEGLEDLSQKIDLNDIPYADGVSYDEKKCCLPNTRNSLLQQIRDWVDCFDEEENERVLLLTGLAGSGKSSIAHSICDHYCRLNRLGSSFFFDVRSSDPPSGETVFSTVARDIADQYPLFKASLARIVHTQRSLRRTKQPSKQFKSFIVESSKALDESDVLRVGPVLIIIDALNECPEESKEDFIQTLVDDLPSLPPNFRVLITSQPDDVRDLLDAGFVRHVDLSSVGPAEAESDIRLFIQQRLTKAARKLDDPTQRPHHNDWLEQLVKRSESLFIWADTACKQIASPKTRAPSKVLDDILKNGGNGIDDLYTLALTRAIGDDNQSLSDFKAVMLRLIILKMPMSVNELNFMQSHVDDTGDEFPSDVSFLVSHLGALLGGALNPNEPIHFLHSSFRDFLLDRKRSGSFCINDEDGFAPAHLSLANTCAAILTLLKSESDPRLTDKANRRPIAYSYLVAKHSKESGRKFDEDLFKQIDSEAMIRWYDQNLFFPEDVPAKDANTALDGWVSLVKLQFDPADYMTKLQASPPKGYSLIISSNDDNPMGLRSRSFVITMSKPTWSTSVCCLVPKGCLLWIAAKVIFLTPKNSVLVWSPYSRNYLGIPIKLGEDVVVQMTTDYNGDYLAALTANNELVFFWIPTRELTCRVALGHFNGLSMFTFPFSSDDSPIIFKFRNAENYPVYDTCSATFYPDMDGVPDLDPSDKASASDAWDLECRYDLL